MSKSSKLTLFIFIALVAGVIFGWLDPYHASKMQPLADAFLRMVKMIIAPLIFATLVVGIAGHGDVKNLGKIGLKTIIYFEIITTIALILGLVMANVFKPGVDFNIDLNTVSLAAVEKMKNIPIDHSFTHMLLDMIPTSVFEAMAEGNLLQIVVFAIFFALAICSIGQKAAPFWIFCIQHVILCLNLPNTLCFLHPSVSLGQYRLQSGKTASGFYQVMPN